MRIIGFLVVVAVASTVEGLRSNGANVCSRNVPYDQTYTERYRQPYKAVGYESCWDWSQGFRCRVTKIHYRTAYRTARRTVYRKQYYCCPGWSVVGDQCTQAICSNACANGGKCTRPEVCQCKSGYSGATCRSDVNECLVGNGGCEQSCDNLFGSYACSCMDGYVLRGDGKTCSDHDECASSTHNCHQKCVNTYGSFACSCEDGFELLADQINCRNIDDCTSNPCNHLCSDDLKGYNCSCYYGYSLTKDEISCKPVCEQGCGIGGYCVQPGICECAEGWGTNSCTVPQCSSCVNGECLQPETCICEEGWEGSDCSLDINECVIENGGCDSICTNVEGSYDCSCDPGYLLSGNRHSCTDHDECASGNHGCQFCVNTKGSYQCFCPDGFYLVDDTDCADINECASNPCDHYCVNEEGSFHCTCSSGYVLDANGRECSDIDECALNKHECSQMCVNTDSWYKCVCDSGYQLQSDGITCLDIDECTTEANGCQQECINTDGSFRCVCHPGFFETEFGCEAICVPMCENKGVCGSPGNCTCDKGWTGSSCEQDIDECSLGTNVCEDICTNVDGGYLCSCKSGFHLVDGHACADIDECVDNSTNRCSSGCVNTIGGYYCTCEPGFNLDTNSFSCSDHDECELDNHDCDYCANTQGSYSCYCPVGYALQSDGKSCQPVCDSCTNGVCASPGNCVCKEGWRGHGCNWEVTLNHWTVKATGCRCYFDNSRTDCACCSYGGCQCTSAQPNLCVQCGYGSTCKIAQNLDGIDGWTVSATGCPCLDSNGDIDLTRMNQCACCQNGGCPCGVLSEGRCMQCGLPHMCELKKPWENLK